MSQLQAEVASLRAELDKFKELIQGSRLANARALDDEPPAQGGASTKDNSPAWSTVVKGSSPSKPKSSFKPQHLQVAPHDSERKFNIVIYGINECQKGTTRLKRMNSDLQSTNNIIQSICPDISS